MKHHKHHKRETHLFDADSKYLLRYSELMKEARIWNNSGQYWLGKQCEIFANKLLAGNTSYFTHIVKTEEHFYKTKKHVH